VGHIASGNLVAALYRAIDGGGQSVRRVLQATLLYMVDHSAAGRLGGRN